MEDNFALYLQVQIAYVVCLVFEFMERFGYEQLAV